MLFKLDNNRNLLPDETAQLFYFPDAISATKAEALFERLKKTIAWKSESIFIYGKEVLQPRLTAWYGEAEAEYTYSGRTNTPLAFTDELLELKACAEAFANTSFNSVLLNYYRNGQDSMGFHRDNEKELGYQPIIASISLGATRDFVVRPYKQTQPRLSFPLASGSLVLMKGTMQQTWEHALPKRAKETAGRINLTFRKIR